MTYIQCALYGIPAVVIHGNSLSLEEWSHWYTPVYIFDGWRFRKYFDIKKSKGKKTEINLDIQKQKLGNQISIF